MPPGAGVRVPGGRQFKEREQFKERDMRYVLLISEAQGLIKTVLVEGETFDLDPRPASYFRPQWTGAAEKIGEVQVTGNQRVLDMMTDIYESD